MARISLPRELWLSFLKVFTKHAILKLRCTNKAFLILCEEELFHRYAAAKTSIIVQSKPISPFNPGQPHGERYTSITLRRTAQPSIYELQYYPARLGTHHRKPLFELDANHPLRANIVQAVSAHWSGLPGAPLHLPLTPAALTVSSGQYRFRPLCTRLGGMLERIEVVRRDIFRRGVPGVLANKQQIQIDSRGEFIIQSCNRDPAHRVEMLGVVLYGSDDLIGIRVRGSFGCMAWAGVFRGDLG